MRLRTLKRHLNRLGLYRRKNFTNVETVFEVLDNDVRHYGQLHGYRWQHQRLLQANIVVTEDTVRNILRIVDPVGVALRRRNRLRRRVYRNPGPNFTWHLDSYDKLKPYGLCINGCIDGYSRYIIWLKLGSTNSDPSVVAGYYIEELLNLGGFPSTVRGDRGTENVKVELLQELLKNEFNSNSNRDAFIWGSSQRNQRIESWWRQLRTHDAQYWMNFFQEMSDNNYFRGTEVDIGLVQFCFSDIIQRELNEVVKTWNNHLIQRSGNAIAPRGRPFNLFWTPDARNYLTKTDKESIIRISENRCRFETFPCEEEVFRFCTNEIKRRNLTFGDEPSDRLRLYLQLREAV